MDTHALLTGPAVAAPVVPRAQETPLHPLTIVYGPNTKKEHALNDYETTWQQLIDEITALEPVAEHDERALLPMKKCIARLNLVQPFDWMNWEVGFPPIEELNRLDINDCVRQITRLVRRDRFMENSLAMCIHVGYFRALCEAARIQAGGERAPSLPKAA